MDRTKKISRIRLSQLGKAEMENRQMNETRAGNKCDCNCNTNCSCNPMFEYIINDVFEEDYAESYDSSRSVGLGTVYDPSGDYC